MKRMEYEKPKPGEGPFDVRPSDESRCKYCLKVLTDGDIVYDRHDCKPVLTLIQGGRA